MLMDLICSRLMLKVLNKLFFADVMFSVNSKLDMSCFSIRAELSPLFSFILSFDTIIHICSWVWVAFWILDRSEFFMSILIWLLAGVEGVSLVLGMAFCSGWKQ